MANEIPPVISDSSLPALRFPWEVLEQRFAALVSEFQARLPATTACRDDQARMFALGRLAEGRGLAGFLRDRLGPRHLRILDVGAGNGGVSFALANPFSTTVFTLDVDRYPEFAAFQRTMGVPVHFLVGNALALPLATASLDAILCLDTLEHLAMPPRFGAEVMRTLRPGGLCMITTPPRVRLLIRPDPHFGIRGLALLPDPVQRWVVERTQQLFLPYDVHHLFWHTAEITRLFPGPKEVEILRDRPWNARPLWQRWLWRVLKGFLWDRIVIYKRG